MHRACLVKAGCQLCQSVVAPGPPPTQESPPHTPRSPPRTRGLRWSRSPPTRSLHACDDDTTLSILATTTPKIRKHMVNY